MSSAPRPGHRHLGKGRTEFVFWAPFARTPSLRIAPQGVLPPAAGAPASRRKSDPGSGGGERILPLEPLDGGYWTVTAENAPPGTEYLFRFDDGRERPDPASHRQPRGVHGPSAVVDHGAFRWTDAAWRGLPLHDMIIYEMHAGTFTPAGTFAAAITRLPALKELGINAIELMPVGQFPGDRNWGYDGVYPWAVQESYGGPEGLRKLVDACHRSGIAVMLDVVYNHLGPEGNYLADFGPYFTDRYVTPWGKALNFDGPESDNVRAYFVGNALHWFDRYRIDGLRVDAVHAVFDQSARPFLQELCVEAGTFARRAGRKIWMIAESDLNDTKTIRSAGTGGHGFDAQWLDDFHHCVHTLLTGERDGYYADYGRLEDLAKCLREGFVYSGQHSRFRRRSHGSPSGRFPPEKFVAFSKNHDQIGNRMLGERMTVLAGFEAVKLQLAVTLLSPYVPLVFMGEEYAEDAPFRYFTSHTDPGLIARVRQGRREEFAAFGWTEEAPDPQDEREFELSKLAWEKRTRGRHQRALEFFRTLVQARAALGPARGMRRGRIAVTADPATGLLTMRRPAGKGSALLFLNFHPEASTLRDGIPAGRWRKVLDSADPGWEGPGPSLPEFVSGGETLRIAPHAAALYLSAGGAVA